MVRNMKGDEAIARLLDGVELRSAPFIVTIYGDVVVPRGGVLWTGTLIDICARVGINESLVRTAVSRLVAARQLAGERAGRRSYYRLDASAQTEFGHAARLLYSTEKPPRGWQVLHAPDLAEVEAKRLRLGHMGGSVYIRPDRDQAPPPGALLLRAAPVDSPEALARFWDLSALQEQYHDINRRFEVLLDAVLKGALSDEASLVARLLLVHLYRNVLLRDPRLPPAALPADWRGTAARALFRRSYLALSEAAERHIAASFEGLDGPLPAHTPESDIRLAGLS